MSLPDDISEELAHRMRTRATAKRCNLDLESILVRLNQAAEKEESYGDPEKSARILMMAAKLLGYGSYT